MKMRKTFTLMSSLLTVYLDCSEGTYYCLDQKQVYSTASITNWYVNHRSCNEKSVYLTVLISAVMGNQVTHSPDSKGLFEELCLMIY